MNKQYFYLVLSILFFTKAFAQNEKDSLVFGIHFKWNNEVLEMNKNYISNQDTLQLNLIKFYVSGIEVNYDDGSIYKEKNSYHLISNEDKNSNSFVISKKENKIISKVIFNIGVDSIASVYGALSGDLDATNGMYWAWQSGFINLKIEGTSASCKTRKKQFQFHIGGYLKPNYALRKVVLFLNKATIDVNVDVSKIFNEIDLKETNSIMIPGQKAMLFADEWVKMFSTE